MRCLSIIVRSIAMILGSLGGLIPIVLPILSLSQEWLNIGYVLIGIAAIFIATNKFFGFSTGHARYVITQLKLEDLLINTALEITQTNDENKHADIAKQAVQKAYGIVIAETQKWEQALQVANDELNNIVHKTK